MDFYRISTVEKSDGTLQLRPDWIVGKTSDLMTRSGQFYAVWDEERKIWSTEIYDVVRLVDADLYRRKEELEAKHGVSYKVASMRSSGTKVWDEFRRYLRNSGDNAHALDETLVFAEQEVKKTDYASKRLPYSIREGDYTAWDTAVSVLYSEEERAKIEWAIGAVLAGDSTKIQKFLVFYGPPGSGKGTVLNVIEKLFVGYTTVFNAKELTGNNNTFSSAAFKDNPLVGIQQDGDLSRIADNTVLNSIVSHETLPVNEKYRAAYPMRMNTFLFMGTNAPVKITDAKSGLIRRLIDVIPTGQTIEHDLYHELVERMDFELGAIAKHCLDRYRAMGKNFYSNYHPSGMMAKTDVFYNFVEACADIFETEDYIKLERAWTLYKAYCAETGVEKGMLPQYKLREELKNYFYVFNERTRIDGIQMRHVYQGFKQLDPVPPIAEMPVKPEGVYTIELQDGSSYFDETYSAQPAQPAKADGTPKDTWMAASTTLADVDTSKLHYVKIPENHIVIDFDLPGEDGEKDLEANLAAAAKWPPTYTELSKSGKGVHLHYIYHGDVTTLANEYAPHIEIKTLLGGASLRRMLTKCNNLTFMPISEGLPTKERPVLTNASMKSERALRELIQKNLRKEVHPGTKPSVDFIEKILDDAYRSEMAYDVTDLRPLVLQFASRSSHQADACIKKVLAMNFASESNMDPKGDHDDDSPIIFFDVEVYPNLFMIVWKAQGSKKTVTMINPSADDVGLLLGKKLVGFNNRRYDNHILYAAYLGKTVEQIYLLSYKIINSGNSRDVLFGEAYNISYADIYDFSSVKMGLKKFQIKLGIFHQELDLPWDQPVPEELWGEVEKYCINDVLSTEAVFEDRKQDFVARQILAELSGLSLNDTTQRHTAKIIFGEDKRANQAFVYTDLADEFPGYVYGENRDEETGKFLGMQSTYKGEVTGEGGYVYAEPGIYENVIVLDIASMHPTSIVQLNLFGPYTKNFKDLLDARLAIKNGNFDDARTMLDGRLAPYLEDVSNAKDLAYALKIVINIVYGLTSAKFDNPFRDRRNHDNIVAKRGALFMVDLKRYMQECGYSVVHIKTDSIKLPVDDLNVTHTIDLVSEFGKKYGYDFEHEFTYERMCLVNDAVYVAKYVDGMWTATGAQFQHPYVFKTLFSDEELEFNDYCESKSVVQGRMYLDFKGNILENFLENGTLNESTRTDEVIHVGRTGSFVPVTTDGADLWRIKDGQKYAVTGTKGYKWITRDMALLRKEKGRLDIDMGYFEALGDKARDAICKYKYNGEEPFEGNSIEWFTHGTELSRWTGPKNADSDSF